MTYKIAERFKSPQGEGVYTGTPMAFIRFVGCSVGKRICQHCDTDFEAPHKWHGGGEFTEEELVEWTTPYEHVCITGGEPFDQDLQPLFTGLQYRVIDPRTTYSPPMIHIETSGTKYIPEHIGHLQETFHGEKNDYLWICVSPKPGFIEEVVMAADEIKVIVPGLGEMTDSLIKTLNVRGPEDMTNGEWRHALRWPDVDDAVRWANSGKIVFLQPRNAKFDIDHVNLNLCEELINEHPNLRLSVQMHKLIRVR